MSDIRLRVPDDIIEGCATALREYLGREPTDDEVGRGLAEMMRDTLSGVKTGPAWYADWLRRVLGEEGKGGSDAE